MKQSNKVMVSAITMAMIMSAGFTAYSFAASDPTTGNQEVRMPGQFQEVRQAIESGDYATWANLMSDRPNADQFVNEDTFAKLQEAQKLIESGDKEGAKAIFDELGIKGPRGGMRGEMNRGDFGRFMSKQNQEVSQ